MSSLNPFAARREKKEAATREKLEHLQQQHLASQQQFEVPETGGDNGLSAEQLAALLPDRSDTYEREDFNKYLPASAHVEQPATTWSPQAGATYQPPSRARQCFGKLQNGFMIGASLGGAVGFLYGTWAAVAYRHVLYLPIAVLQAGGGFGFFLACGTVIRCEEPGACAARQAQDWRRPPRAAEAPAVPEMLELCASAPHAQPQSGVVSALTCTGGATTPSRRSAVVSAVFEP